MDPEKYRKNLHAVVSRLGARFVLTDARMAGELGASLGTATVLDATELDGELDGGAAAVPRRDDEPLFIGAGFFNGVAFLERFPITVEQEYPSTTVEKKIVNNKMEFYGKVDAEFADKLINWADIIRKTFKEGGVDEIISTRRLVNIVQAYSIFEDRVEAINYCINRFDDDTKTAFMDLWAKMNAPVSEVQTPAPTLDDEVPF